MSVRKRVWVTRTGESKMAWVVDYVDGTGERHIRTFQTKKTLVLSANRLGLMYGPAFTRRQAKASPWLKLPIIG